MDNGFRGLVLFVILPCAVVSVGTYVRTKRDNYKRVLNSCRTLDMDVGDALGVSNVEVVRKRYTGLEEKVCGACAQRVHST